MVDYGNGNAHRNQNPLWDVRTTVSWFGSVASIEFEYCTLEKSHFQFSFESTTFENYQTAFICTSSASTCPVHSLEYFHSVWCSCNGVCLWQIQVSCGCEASKWVSTIRPERTFHASYPRMYFSYGNSPSIFNSNEINVSYFIVVLQFGSVK